MKLLKIISDATGRTAFFRLSGGGAYVHRFARETSDAAIAAVARRPRRNPAVAAALDISPPPVPGASAPASASAPAPAPVN